MTEHFHGKMSLWTPLCRSLSALLPFFSLMFTAINSNCACTHPCRQPCYPTSLICIKFTLQLTQTYETCCPPHTVLAKTKANQSGSDTNNLTSMLCKREQGLGPISKLFCTLVHLDLICLGLCLCLSVSSPTQTVILNQLAAEWGEWSSLQREVLGKTLLPGDNCPGSGHLHLLVRQQLLYSLCRNPSSFWTAV